MATFKATVLAFHYVASHWSNLCLSGQLAVFIYYAVWKPQKQWVTLGEGIWNSPLTYKSDRREEAWRFVSYMFVHAG